MPEEEANTIVSGNNFSVDIFPNPARDILYYVIKGTIDMQVKITVSDVHGNVTTKFKKPLDAIAINDKIIVEKLNAGIYFITFSNGLNQQTFKFLKIK